MKPRAVIFDVYGTLLALGPAPSDASAAWEHLLADYLKPPPPLTHPDFAVACARLIEQQHEKGRSRGIRYPEIIWSSVVCEVLPQIGALSSERRNDFIYRERQLTRSTVLSPQAGTFIARLRGNGCLLGVASNAQRYTWRELQDAFVAAGINWTPLFESDLCFWSFEHGFSKPDPHVFQILSARLHEHGIEPAETLMIGDRVDNDIQPAAAFGWTTWWLAANAPPGTGGSWEKLAQTFKI